MKLSHFRVLSAVEGLSLIALLFVAMPLRHYFDMNMAVRVVGMVHGVLWLIYLCGSLSVSHKARWSVFTWMLSVVLSVVPFGFVVMDRVLSKQMSEV